MLNAINNKNKAGELATSKKIFGERSRYAVAAVHTRFDEVQWFVWDAERADENGLKFWNGVSYPAVIRQSKTYEEAIAGLK